MLAKCYKPMPWYDICSYHNDFLSCAFRLVTTKFTNLFWSEYN